MRDKIIEQNKNNLIEMAEKFLTTLYNTENGKENSEIYESIIEKIEKNQSLSDVEYSLVILLTEFFADKFSAAAIKYSEAEKELNKIKQKLKENF